MAHEGGSQELHLYLQVALARARVPRNGRDGLVQMLGLGMKGRAGGMNLAA